MLIVLLRMLQLRMGLLRMERLLMGQRRKDLQR